MDIQFLGKLNSFEELRKVYSMADILIIPSYQDNLPNVMLEALFCGTPVISFDDGGMKDVIINGMNGYIFKERTASALIKVLLKFSQE
jgi:glycosyltransferase involved in cell wall biosynthesis